MADGTASRRKFLKVSATASCALGAAALGSRRAGGAHVLPLRAPPARVPSPNDKIHLALIGAGLQGQHDTNVALQVSGTELVAASDCYDGRMARCKERWGKHLMTARHYEEILARADVDAVIVATSDHWHQKVALDAMNAGKDVYVEKPMVQHADQGWALIDAAKKTGRILQVGSQRVSSIVYAKARELIESGAIGELNLVEAYIDRNSALGAWQYSIPPDASPETIDWARYLGRAPKRPFEAMRLFRFRNYRDYGTGVAGDLFVHLFSGIHYILASNGPTRILATGGLRFWKDGRDVPDVMLAFCDYPKSETHPSFNLALRVDFAAGAGERSQFRFVGSEGVLTLEGREVRVAKMPRSKAPGYTIETFPEAVQEAFLEKYYERYPEEKPSVRQEHMAMRQQPEDVWVAPPGYDANYHHFANFFDAVRTRKTVVEDATFGLRAAGPAVLSNVSYFEERPVSWDADRMVEVTGEKTKPTSAQA
ncbi:MAG: gfo/Idh/MocA family oxidoreductase [Luteitalea sp.]|nr:gfo/Idh/MocA family oxidoreductase [Luteitalea sp.]